MSELGRLLEEARTAKQSSLADVEAAIRVRQKYLEALEQGNYGVLPPGAIARGFLRNYARFLELDPGEVLGLYGQESGDRGPAPVASGNRQARPVDYRPLEVTLMNEQGGRGGAWRWVLALLVVAALVAGAWWALNNTTWGRTLTPSSLLIALAPQSSRQAAGAAASRTPTAPPTRQPASSGASPLPSYTVTPPPDPGTPLPTPASVPVAAKPEDTQAASGSTQPTPSPTSDLLTLPIPTARPSPTPIPTATPTPTPEAVTSGISLTLKITQRAWVKVTADGNVVMQDLLEAGQQRSWQAVQQITVLTGNAGGTTLSLNGQELGAMGNVGQVVERSWVVEQDKVPEVTPNRPTPTPGG